MPAELRHLEHGAYSLSGDLDYASVAELCKSAPALFAAQIPETIELSSVSRSDSSGVALLIAWTREATIRARQLRFLDMPEQMKALVRVSGLQNILVIENSD